MKISLLKHGLPNYSFRDDIEVAITKSQYKNTILLLMDKTPLKEEHI
jgi:hypothetical protein